MALSIINGRIHIYLNFFLSTCCGFIFLLYVYTIKQKQLKTTIMKTTNKTNDINNYLNLKWAILKALNGKPEWNYVTLKNLGLTDVYKANR